MIVKKANELATLPTSVKESESLVRRLEAFYLRTLKATYVEEGISLFEDKVFEKISNMNNISKKVLIDKVKEARRLESNPALLLGINFPTLHARVTEVVLEELQERFGDPKVQLDFLVQNIISKEKQRLEDDYSFALPLLGQGEAEDFASCMLELRMISTEPTVNEELLRKSMVNSLKTGDPLEVVHIKSLRYTYPQKGGVEILNTTNEALSIGIKGEKRRYPSEGVIFERLRNIRKLLRFYGIDSKLTVIAADRDLDYLFPAKNPLVNETKLREAKEQAFQYLNYLKLNHPEVDKITTLNEYLSESGTIEDYEEICKLAIFEAKKGGGKLVSEKVLEMRVNHQFAHYREMFGVKYTRDLARFTATHQIANILALSAVFESFSNPPVVVIDERGFETNLIGAYEPNSRSIFLTKLKDPVELVE